MGRKQVIKRSTHARPGMHMEQCSAVQSLSTMDTSSVSSSLLFGLRFVGRSRLYSTTQKGAHRRT